MGNSEEYTMGNSDHDTTYTCTWKPKQCLQYLKRCKVSHVRRLPECAILLVKFVAGSAYSRAGCA